jgi:hypothetical protein
MIEYVKDDLTIRDSLNKNVSKIWTGITLTPGTGTGLKQDRLQFEG